MAGQNILNNAKLVLPRGETGATPDNGNGAIPGWTVASTYLQVYSAAAEGIQDPPGCRVHGQSGRLECGQTVKTTAGWTYLLQLYESYANYGGMAGHTVPADETLSRPQYIPVTEHLTVKVN